MADQIVITEKTSQAKDVRAAVGSRYGDVLAAEGHLFELVEPEDVDPAWKRWSTALLKPDGLYGTRPARGGNKAAKLKAIREALRRAKQVWIATDCDREGQLIGQEILEHYNYRGTVMRVMFTAQDARTIREAFAQAKPNAAYASLYAAAVARRQADQIYNLSLTRTATVTLGKGARGVIGVGRVKTPTLAIVCRRELEIRDFVPTAYFEIIADAKVRNGRFRMRHAPKDRIIRRDVAEAAVRAARDCEGPLAVRIEEKRQRPPRLHDLPSLQKLCGSRFGWSAARTLEVAQDLYDGNGRKIITYPRAEVRYLPQSLIADVPRLAAGLRAHDAFGAIPVPDPPLVRKGASGVFHDKGLQGASHHAVIPNVNTIGDLPKILPRLSGDETKLFDVIARSYLAALMPDYRYRQTTATLDAGGVEFRATGRQPIDLGWRAAFPGWKPAEEKGEAAQSLPALRDGASTKLENPTIEDKETRPPPRYNEGTLIEAMQTAWRFAGNEALKERLKDAKGIGTPATRAEIINGLKKQSFLTIRDKAIVPTETGLSLYGILKDADAALVDPGATAELEYLLDDVLGGKREMRGAVDAVCDAAARIIGNLANTAAIAGPPLLGSGAAGADNTKTRPPTPAMKRFAASIARRKGIELPSGYTASIAVCRAFLDEHAPGKQDGGTSVEAPPGPATAAQIAFAERIAREKNIDIPGAARASVAAMARWIDANKGTGQGKGRRKATGGKPGPAAPGKTAGKRTRKQSGNKAGAPPRPAGRNAEAGTPLAIPYGNKDIALKLGARYRPGGWYAPAGVDLAAFKARGWYVAEPPAKNGA